MNRKIFGPLIFSLILPLVTSASVKEHFVDIQRIDPTIQVEARYFGEHNFIGKKIRGYQAPKCLLTKEAALALGKVQAELKEKNLTLRVYDCYRPQRAVNHFVEWAKDLNDIKMKSEFYPRVDKTNLFKDGYIAEKSGHSRGSTLDLTIDGLDMGSPYDFFDPISHTENPRISKTAMKNRRLLKTTMEKYGFKNLPEEWWHYTLRNEPYPDQYFDFVVK